MFKLFKRTAKTPEIPCATMLQIGPEQKTFVFPTKAELDAFLDGVDTGKTIANYTFVGECSGLTD